MRFREIRLCAVMSLFIVLSVGSAGTGIASVGRVETLSQPNFPVTIKQAMVQNSPITRETTFQYTIRNLNGEQMEQVKLFILLLNKDGNPRAGQMLDDRFNLAPGKTEHRTIRLGNLLYVGPQESARMVVGLMSARGEFTSWDVSLSPQFLTAMGTGGSSPFSQVTTSQITASFTTNGASNCPTNWCGECGTSAVTICGQGNVASYACSINGVCSCEFSCAGGDDGDDDSRQMK